MKKIFYFFTIIIISFISAFFAIPFFTGQPANQSRLQKTNQVSLDQVRLLMAENTQKTDKKYQVIIAELNQLKKQYQEIKGEKNNTAKIDSTGLLPKGDNTVNQSSEPSTKEEHHTFLEQRKKSAKREIEKARETYEDFYNDGADDSEWRNRVEEIFHTLISDEKFGKNVSLQSVDCTTNMCVVKLLSPVNGSINTTPTALFLALKGGSISGDTNPDTSSGLKETSLYITKPGKSLPFVNTK